MSAEFPSPSLRLSAMGNLRLVIADEYSEINLCDFGKNPAGLLEDNEGRSLIRAKGVWSKEKPESGNSLQGEGVYHYKNITSISGEYCRSSWNFSSTGEEGEEVKYKPQFDTWKLAGALNVAHGVTPLGFSLRKREGSLFFTSQKYSVEEIKAGVGFGKENAKLGITFTSYHSKTTFDTTAVQIISFHGIFDLSNNLTFAAQYNQGKLKKTEYYGNYYGWQSPRKVSHNVRSFSTRGSHTIVGEPGNLKLGFQVELSNFVPYEFLGYYSYEKRKRNSWGLGMGYEYKKKWRVGMEYHRENREEYYNPKEYFSQNEINFGGELSNILSLFSLRLGVGLKSYESGLFVDNYCFGIGYLAPNKLAKIDLTYNLEKSNYSYYGALGGFNPTDRTLGFLLTLYSKTK
ncbi:MAG: hypothetical protein AB1393_10410 [Candidatus Edwardsbacteria bacterium]